MVSHPPLRFPELSRLNPHTAEPGERPAAGTARAGWTLVVSACARRSGHLLFGKKSSSSLKISLGEGKGDAAPSELAIPRWPSPPRCPRATRGLSPASARRPLSHSSPRSPAGVAAGTSRGAGRAAHRRAVPTPPEGHAPLAALRFLPQPWSLDEQAGVSPGRGAAEQCRRRLS